jgi:hypothetical protein
LREVEAPTFSDIRATDGARLSALHTGRFLPPGRFVVLISVRGCVDSRAIVQLEGLCKWENPPRPGLEPATIQLVTQPNYVESILKCKCI